MRAAAFIITFKTGVNVILRASDKESPAAWTGLDIYIYNGRNVSERIRSLNGFPDILFYFFS